MQQPMSNFIALRREKHQCYQPSPFTPKIPLYKILKVVKQSGGHSDSGWRTYGMKLAPWCEIYHSLVY